MGKNAYNTTMAEFKDALLDGVRGDVLTEQEFQDIHADYLSSRETEGSKYLLELMKEISFLETKFDLTTRIIQVLAEGYSRDLVMELKRYGYKGRFDWSDQLQYAKDLAGVLSASKRTVSLMQHKEAELDRFIKSQQAGSVTVDRKFFTSWEVTLSKFMGYRVAPDCTMVADWCEMINKYEAYIEVKNSEKKPVWQTSA